MSARAEDHGNEHVRTCAFWLRDWVFVAPIFLWAPVLLGALKPRTAVMNERLVDGTWIAYALAVLVAHLGLVSVGLLLESPKWYANAIGWIARGFPWVFVAIAMLFYGAITWSALTSSTVPTASLRWWDYGLAGVALLYSITARLIETNQRKQKAAS